jgi:hypothetical protein
MGNALIPSLRDETFFTSIPGNKLPGYDRVVPTGRCLLEDVPAFRISALPVTSS